MVEVDWDKFAGLPGARERNFEYLCRALIRRHYGPFGKFGGLANQPGVEFHLRIEESCALGQPGSWFGWQCRWYDLAKGRPLGITRKKKIEDAVRKTEEHVPGITDWVLWTRHPLTKGDQEWFDGLSSTMKLSSWSSYEVEEHLAGPGELLRATYFGELLLTERDLEILHNQQVAPVRNRWLPAVHQTVDAERSMRRLLLQPDYFSDARGTVDRLFSSAATLTSDADRLPDGLGLLAQQFLGQVQRTANALQFCLDCVELGEFEALSAQLGDMPPQRLPNLLLRRLRGANSQLALALTNLMSDLRLGSEIVRSLNKAISTKIVALTAEAGCGKTQLAAQLSSPGPGPAGVFFRGRELHAGQSLDDLARRLTVRGVSLPNFESLIAAVDAAGVRGQRRLAITIDGLNEAEDPRDYKPELARLREAMADYTHVLVIVTVRPGFKSEAVPDGVDTLEMPDFDEDTLDAVRRYFEFYRISIDDARDVELPIQLSHPLTLRMFCEVTNRQRMSTVGVEQMPVSLNEVFHRYLEQVADRITETSSRIHRFYQQDVLSALRSLGSWLWENKSRQIDLGVLRTLLGDAQRSWSESIVRALESEGVLLRVPGDERAAQGYIVVYDLLAGFIVADYLVSERGRSEFETWLREEQSLRLLTEHPPSGHPLGRDIFAALIELLPSRNSGQQVWTLVEEPHRSIALRLATNMQGKLLDRTTVLRLEQLLIDGGQVLLPKMRQLRGALLHPLNAEFFDRAIRRMLPAARDQMWSEWLRLNGRDILGDIERMEARWRSTDVLDEARESLRARWLAWCLTSTVHNLRDRATRALYAFGRRFPSRLFDLSLDDLEVNDEYVGERLLSAAYGVCMANQDSSEAFEEALEPFLRSLLELVQAPYAKAPTNHWLSRYYIQGIFQFAARFYSDLTPVSLRGQEQRLLFAPGRSVTPIIGTDERANECDQTLGMDFENYTLGSLFEDRGNYQSGHPGHTAAVSHVRGVVWEYGWREARLGEIDRQLAAGMDRGDRARVERYGKKYGWIGFYTQAGILHDSGALPDSLWYRPHPDIDPSFPEAAPRVDLPISNWLDKETTDDRIWVTSGEVAVSRALLQPSQVGGLAGPWVLAGGHVSTPFRHPTGRQVFGLFTTLLVSSEDTNRLMTALEQVEHPGRHWLPEAPEDFYTFAGEITWSPRFAAHPDYEGDLYRGRLELGGERISDDLEVLFHRYAWEGHHSSLNEAGGTIVPSKSLGDRFALRGSPQGFAYHRPGSDTEVQSVHPDSSELEGSLLYVRDSLIREYAGDRSIVLFAWGERNIPTDMSNRPEWLEDVYRTRADVWRSVQRLHD